VGASSAGHPQLVANRPTILIVENEVLVRWMVADELRANGFSVLEVPNGGEALAILQTSASVSLVMTDVRMPGSIDGIALAQWVRVARPDLKVIIGSGQSLDDVPTNLADAVFIKPYDVLGVVRRIKELLASL
jgi:CheY-like chemotaxis protein